MIFRSIMPHHLLSRFCFGTACFLFVSVSRLLPYIVAAIASALATYVLVMIAPIRGWVVVPRQNRWNKRVVAQFGGIPVLLVFLIVGLYLSHDLQTRLLILLTLGMGLLGLIDDVIGLGPRPKLVVESLLAGFAAYNGVLFWITPYILVNQVLTVIWIIGITNAFNLIDNMDGLAAGVGLITLASMVLFAGSQVGVAALLLSMLAALTGFYSFNTNPARIFMGDAGALAIGFFIACSSACIVHSTSGLEAIFLTGLLLVIPIFDMLLVIFTRIRNSRTVYDGARDHASHRLVFLGLTERCAVAVLYGIAGTAGVLVIFWNVLSSMWKFGLISFFVTAVLLFWIYLARLDLPGTWLSLRKSGPVRGAQVVLSGNNRDMPSAHVMHEFEPK